MMTNLNSSQKKKYPKSESSVFEAAVTVLYPGAFFFAYIYLTG